MSRIEKKANVFAVIDLPQLVDSSKIDELLGSDNRRYNGGYKGKSVKRGIPLQDEKRYPQLASEIGVGFGDNNWANAVNMYWAEFNQFIPFGKMEDSGKVVNGRTLDASYTINDNGEIYCDNFTDFVLFNLMQDDKEVALSPDLYSQRRSYSFFCIDATVEAARTKDLIETKMKATLAMAQLFNETEGVDSKQGYLKALASRIDPEVSTVLTRQMSPIEVNESIMRGVEKNPKAFLEALADTQLQRKAFVKSCVEAGFIHHVGNTYVYLNESFSLESLLAFLGSPDGATERNKLQAQLDEYLVFDPTT